MKILMVSMFSNHFFNWANQLRNAGHEIFWIDVFDSNTYGKKIDFIEQIIGWRFKWDYPGRYHVKKRMPDLYKSLNKINERKLEQIFERKIQEINPDIVHSFVMYSACVPILNVMRRYPTIKWVYSAWGNDLFFYKEKEQYLDGMKKVLPQIDFMFADCKRDSIIAKDLGFKGTYLGTFPTGGGYEFENYTSFILPFSERKSILVKGYQHKFGRCNTVLDSLKLIQEEIKDFKIIVFGANEEVQAHIKKLGLWEWPNFKILGKTEHQDVLKLMGESLIYIGNSISDGMPNTLLEAIVMEAFPIQSNPGGATGEIIEHGVNGYLIEHPEDPGEIAGIIRSAVGDLDYLRKAIAFNSLNIKPKLDRSYVKNQVLEKYTLIEQSLED